ncbi:MAG: SDR family oxidoreductase [Gemmataceae bacterium]|nr:SDR family oxidoreductase [Gemmataceae bacterium]
MKLEGKVAIITGGGSGMGREIALEYAKEGASVVIASNAREQNEQVAAECRTHGGRALPVYADVAKEDDVRAMVQTCVDEFGKLDVLVCVAGIGMFAVGGRGHLNIWETSREQWEKVLDVNLNGTFLACKYAIPHMIRNGGGSIVTFSSGTVRFPIPHEGPYTTSKFAIEGFTKILAQECEPQNIRVNALQPGGVTDTGLLGPQTQDSPDRDRSDYHRPSVVRAAAVYLASDESRMITGRSIVASVWNQEHGLVLCPCSRCSTRTAKLAIEWRGLTAL